MLTEERGHTRRGCSSWDELCRRGGLEIYIYFVKSMTHRLYRDKVRAYARADARTALILADGRAF